MRLWQKPSELVEHRCHLVAICYVSDPHQAYRENIQKYAKEDQRVWEDLHHGILVGTEKFVKKIKQRYLPDIPHSELPSQKRLVKDVNIDILNH